MANRGHHQRGGQEEIGRYLTYIRSMPRIEMARLWQFASSIHPFFDPDGPYLALFKSRLIKLGGLHPRRQREARRGAN